MLLNVSRCTHFSPIKEIDFGDFVDRFVYGTCWITELRRIHLQEFTNNNAKIIRWFKKYIEYKQSVVNFVESYLVFSLI